MPAVVNRPPIEDSAQALGDAAAVDPRQFVNALRKGMSVLEAFSAHPGPMSLQEIAQHCGSDKSTVQRMVYTLLHLGYIRKGLDGRGFCLGPKVLDRSFDFLRSWPLIERATPVINELQRSAQERVDLSIFDDLTICYAIRRQTKRVTFYSTLIGRRIPTYCSSGGRAIMARLSDGEVDSIIARSDLTALTPKTIVEPGEIWRQVKQARKSGFSLVHDESLIGEVAVACAVLDHRARPVAAVHIAGSLSEWDAGAFAKRFAPLVSEAAGALSGAIAPF